MAEGENTTSSNSWENWLGGWVQTAKEKSSTALEMVKKDLAEFTCTMQKDTEKAVEMTKDSLNKENTTHATNKLKSGLTSFLDNISKALVIPPDDDDDIPMKVAADGSGIYDSGKARLHAIQLDAGTYIDPPRGSPEQFNMWSESFNMEQHKGEISELLVSKVEVRALYTKLVPGEVSHAEFWLRYFYRVHQLKCDEARKQALMKRADQTKGDSISWDDDDDWSGEEEDGDHSDWEKMPRPPQSYAASAQSITQHSEKQAKPSTSQTVTTDNVVKQPIETQKQESVASASSVQNSEANSLRNDVEKPKEAKDNAQAKSMETSMSAFAAGSSETQPEKECSKLSDAVVDSEASPSMQKASDDTQIQQPPTNLWSLHIPDDTASASQQGQEDTESPEKAVPEPGSPSNVCERTVESDKVLSGSSSCAAADGYVAATDDQKSGVTTADGACGAIDMGPAPLSQGEQLPKPAPDVSAASVEVTAEPQPSLLPVQDASPHDADSGVGSAQVADAPVDLVSPSLGDSSAVENISALATPSVTTPQPAAETVQSTCETPNAPSDPPAAPAAVEGTVKPTPQAQEEKQEIQSAPEPEQLPAKGAEASVAKEDVESGEMKEIGMRVKGDMVVVGDRGSPSSSSDTNDTNELKELGLEDDWEQDFDIEITEDDLKAAEDIAKKLGENLNADDDDWENWE